MALTRLEQAKRAEGGKRIGAFIVLAVVLGAQTGDEPAGDSEGTTGTPPAADDAEPPAASGG